MFLRSFALMTPIAVGGVWAAGGLGDFSGFGSAEPIPYHEYKIVHDEFSEVCQEIRAGVSEKLGEEVAAKKDTTGAGGMLSAMGAVADMERALGEAGCPTNFGPRGDVDSIGAIKDDISAELSMDEEEEREQAEEFVRDILDEHPELRPPGSPAD
jgi:hypothetical protein